MKTYFTSERNERVKYFSTLEDKCRISERPGNFLFIRQTSIKYQDNDFLDQSFILINNDLEIHKQVQTNEIKFQRFGDFMTPLSRNDLMNSF